MAEIQKQNACRIMKAEDGINSNDFSEIKNVQFPPKIQRLPWDLSDCGEAAGSHKLGSLWFPKIVVANDIISHTQSKFRSWIFSQY